VNCTDEFSGKSRVDARIAGASARSSAETIGGTVVTAPA
jgi:hypothetical protein